MSVSFAGKRILVTGAGQGIGRGLSLRLSKLEAKVIALSRTKEYLDTLQNEDPRITTVVADVKDWDVTRETVKSVLPIDMLVNNAGVVQLVPFLDLTNEIYEQVMDINLKAALNVSQIVAKNMIERKVAGSIVNVSSIASQMVFKNYLAYGISKSGLDMLTRSMARELGRHNIRVNSVNPTGVMTNMAKHTFKKEVSYQALLKKTVLGRFPEVDEVADTIIFLLSDRSKMITGAILPIDAGLFPF